MDDQPEQEALFSIEGPDERGCVWMHSTSSADPWAYNLGPRDKVAEAMSQWLESIDYDDGPNGKPQAAGSHVPEDDDAPPVIKLMTDLTDED